MLAWWVLPGLAADVCIRTGPGLALDPQGTVGARWMRQDRALSTSLSLDSRCAFFQAGLLFPVCTHLGDVPCQEIFGSNLDWLPRKEGA